MENEKSPGVDLLISYLFDDITAEELPILYQYMEKSPALKERFEYYSNPIHLTNRVRMQFDYDNDAMWEQLKAKHDIP